MTAPLAAPLYQSIHQRSAQPSARVPGAVKKLHSYAPGNESCMRGRAIQPVRLELRQPTFVQIRCTTFDTQTCDLDRQHLLSNSMASEG